MPCQPHGTAGNRGQPVVGQQEASGLQHGARVLQGQRLFESIVVDKNVGAHEEIEAIRRGQIQAFENNIEIHRLTGQNHVRTDSYRSRLQALGRSAEG